MNRAALYLSFYSIISLPGYITMAGGVDLSEVYSPGAPLISVLLFHVGCILMLAILCAVRFIRPIPPNVIFEQASTSRRINAVTKILRFERVLIWAFLVWSILIAVLGLNDYRHSSSFLINAGFILPFELIRSCLLAFFVLRVCDPWARLYAPVLPWRLFIFFIGSVIGNTGSFFVFQAILLLSLMPFLGSSLSSGRIVVYGILGFSGLTVAIIIGFANKYGFDPDIVYRLFFEETEFVVSYLAWRVGTGSHALAYWLSNYESIAALQYIWSETSFRVSSLVGIVGQGPDDIRSFARLNYLNIFIDNTHPRSGTTPGLFAGLAALLPYNVSATVLYLLISVTILRLFSFYSRDLCSAPRMAFMVIATYHFLDSPLDLLITPHPTQISLILFIFILYFPRLRFGRV